MTASWLSIISTYVGGFLFCLLWLWFLNQRWRSHRIRYFSYRIDGLQEGILLSIIWFLSIPGVTILMVWHFITEVIDDTDFWNKRILYKDKPKCVRSDNR